MSDTNTPDDGGNVVDFARRTGRTGFNLTPTLTLDPPVIPPPPPGPPPAPASGPGGSGTGGRRSPLDIVAALPDPGILQPPVAPPAPPATPGHVPATFRSEPAGDMTGPRLGALSLAACLAVAVAALRGTHTVVSTWWENRQARLAETAPLREARLKHQTAMQQIADKAVQQRAKTHSKVPSSSEFGRKSLSGRSGSGSGGGSGRGGSGSSKSSGGTRSGGTGGSGSGAGSKRQRGLFNSGSSGSGAGGGKGKGSGSGTGSWLGGGSGGRKHNAGGKNNARLNTGKGPGGGNNSPKTPNTHTPKNPGTGAGGGKKNRAGGQGAGHSAASGGQHPNTKQRPNNGTGSSGRTSLAQATGKTLKKAAARRLKRRRNNPPTPAVWNLGPNKPGNTNTTGKGSGKGPKATKNTPPPNGAPGSSSPHTGAQNTTSQGKGSGNSKGAKPRKGTARTTLAAALRHGAYQAALRRLKQRRKTPGTPPIWSTHRRRKNTRNAAAAGSSGASSRSRTAGTWWARTAANARRKASQRGWSNGPRTTGSTSQTGTGSTAGQGGTWPGPGGHQRGTPFQNASQATAATTYTVQRANTPGANAKRWQPAAVTTGQPVLPRTGPAALPAAPTPHTARPGTTRPKEPIAMPPASGRPDPRIVKAKKQAARAAARTVGRQMDAQHETEITLDDACDAADELSTRAFNTHDQASKLSRRASKLRSAWITLAEHCATDNNLIGDLFTAAALRFAESMELVDRMAEEMSATSLNAAEKAETAGNEINDAYRPYNTATADAGLTTPSAPVHNET